jgi:branched-chain amino acid transport system substrate-binding protein
LEFAVELLGGKIAGREVQIIVGDAQSDASRAADVARQMVEQDGVAAIFGPTQAGHKAAVAEYVETAGIPLIPYNGSPAALFENSEWLVGAGGMNPQMPTVMADYVYKELGYKNVSVLTMDNMGFRTFANDFMRVFTALGGAVAQEQYAPFPADDWSPYMAAMQDADAIMSWTTGSNAIALWNQWYSMGVNERIPISAFMASAFTDYYVVGAVKGASPEAAEAILGTVAPSMYVYDIDTPENKAFVEAWKAKFGSVPQTNVAGLCYQAYLLFHTAVEALNGDTAPDKLIAQLFATDINGPTGRLFFQGSHAATMDVYIVKVIQMEDGSYNYGIVKTYEDVPPEGV